MAQTKYNPELWLESSVRAIKDYISNGLPVNVYEVVMEFPGTLLDEKKIPFDKPIIHFEIDDIRTSLVGMGDNVFAINYDAPSQTVNPQSALKHLINFDVGVWSWDKTGGTTARMRARQYLTNLLATAQSIENLRAASSNGDGAVEIISYSGGRAVLDSINDVPVYRLVDGQLEIRVFSRTPTLVTPTAPAIETIVQSPGLTILG